MDSFGTFRGDELFMYSGVSPLKSKGLRKVSKPGNEIFILLIERFTNV